MTIHTKVSGSWKEVSQPSVKVSGAWKNCTGVYTRVSGAWKTVWEAVAEEPDAYIAVALNDSPYFTLLKRFGDNVSKASTYTLAGTGYGCSWY